MGNAEQTVSAIFPTRVTNHSKGFGSTFFFSIFWANIGRSRNLAYDIELCFVSLKFVMIVQSYISLMLSQKGKENKNTDCIWILQVISKPVHVIGKNCDDIAVVY